MSRTPKAADFARGWPRRCSDLRGLRVRFRREAQNGWAVIPAGAEGVVEFAPSRWDRLPVRAEACKTCGIALRINVDWTALEPVVANEEAK